MNATDKARHTLKALAEQRTAAKESKSAKRQEWRGNAPLALAYLMMAATFAVSAWSAYHLVAEIPNVPTEIAVLAFAAIEGAWVVCVLLMVKWQNETSRLFQFNKANRLAKQVYWGSLALNFGHGLILVDGWGGLAAGAVLCVFPYVFKELFSVAVTNRVEELRHLGLAEVLADRYKVNALARFHEHDDEHPNQPEPHPNHEPNRAFGHPNQPEPALTGGENSAVRAPEPRPEPAGTTPEPVVPNQNSAPEPPSSRPERVEELAELIRTRGSMSLNEVMDRYQVAKTTASALRKDAQTLLAPYA